MHVDTDKLDDSYSALGVEEVKRRLALGVYSPAKAQYMQCLVDNDAGNNKELDGGQQGEVEALNTDDKESE